MIFFFIVFILGVQKMSTWEYDPTEDEVEEEEEEVVEPIIENEQEGQPEILDVLQDTVQEAIKEDLLQEEEVKTEMEKEIIQEQDIITTPESNYNLILQTYLDQEAKIKKYHAKIYEIQKITKDLRQKLLSFVSEQPDQEFREKHESRSENVKLFVKYTPQGTRVTQTKLKSVVPTFINDRFSKMPIEKRESLITDLIAFIWSSSKSDDVTPELSYVYESKEKEVEFKKMQKTSKENEKNEKEQIKSKKKKEKILLVPSEEEKSRESVREMIPSKKRSLPKITPLPRLTDDIFEAVSLKNVNTKRTKKDI